MKIKRSVNGVRVRSEESGTKVRSQDAGGVARHPFTRGFSSHRSLMKTPDNQEGQGDSGEEGIFDMLAGTRAGWPKKCAFCPDIHSASVGSIEIRLVSLFVSRGQRQSIWDRCQRRRPFTLVMHWETSLCVPAWPPKIP